MLAALPKISLVAQEDFDHKRKNHYNEMHAVRAMKAKMAAAVPRNTSNDNDCTTCRNVMKHCYCSYCDDEALVDGVQFGYSIYSLKR